MHLKVMLLLGTAATGPSKAPGSSFNIASSNVPVAECTKIVTAAAGNFYEVGVGVAANVKAAGDVLDVAKTATQCSAGGNSNTFIFTAIKKNTNILPHLYQFPLTIE